MLSLMQAIDPLYSASGFAVGLLVGMTGVGGGSLMTPLLILLFGIHPATAVGTDLLYASATKVAGTAVHGLNRTIDWTIVRRLASGSVPATVATLLCLALIDIKGATARDIITGMLTVALFLTAIALLARDRITKLYAAHVGSLDERRTAIATTTVGAILGVLVSVTSVGAGAIGVMALVLLYPRLPTARVVGSDIAHAVPLTLAAGIGHWFLGSVDWHIFASLLVGSVPGIILGSLFAVRVPDRALRYVLAATLILVASKLSADLNPISSITLAFVGAH
jgi:uncharacterized membrane protein YfcA